MSNFVRAQFVLPQPAGTLARSSQVSLGDLVRARALARRCRGRRTLGDAGPAGQEVIGWVWQPGQVLHQACDPIPGHPCTPSPGFITPGYWRPVMRYYRPDVFQNGIPYLSSQWLPTVPPAGMVAGSAKPAAPPATGGGAVLVGGTPIVKRIFPGGPAAKPTVQPAASAPAPASSNSLTGLFARVPWWGWAALAGGGLWLASRHGGGR